MTAGAVFGDVGVSFLGAGAAAACGKILGDSRSGRRSKVCDRAGAG